jgi:hypothetical protein
MDEWVSNYTLSELATMVGRAWDELILMLSLETSLALIDNPDNAPALLDCMEASEDDAIRYAVAKIRHVEEAYHEKIKLISAETLPVDFSLEADFPTRLKQAEDPNTLPERLAQLARSSEWFIRYHVAQRQQTLPETLAQLAEGADLADDWVLLQYIGRNPSTPSKTLVELALNEHHEVRAAAAQNRSTPPDVLEALTQDVNWHVRGATAANPKTPSDARSRLVDDDVPFVHYCALLNRSYQPGLAERCAEAVAVAANISAHDAPSAARETR